MGIILEAQVSFMNDAIEEIRVWMERNFVKLNSKKTEYMLISSPHMRNTMTSIDVTVGRETVSPSDSARNLGVYFDKSMNMDRHISHICPDSILSAPQGSRYQAFSYSCSS